MDDAAAEAAPTAAGVETAAAALTSVDAVAAAVVNVFDTPVDRLIVAVVFGCCDCLLMSLLLLDKIKIK